MCFVSLSLSLSISISIYIYIYIYMVAPPRSTFSKNTLAKGMSAKGVCVSTPPENYLFKEILHKNRRQLAACH